MAARARTAAPSRCGSSAPTATTTTRQELGTRNIKVALRRLRKFARQGSHLELDLPDTIRSTAANAGWLDIKMIPERHNNVKVLLLMDVGGTMDDHIQRVEELFSAVKTEFKHLEFYYFHNCVYDFMWKNNRRRFAEKFDTWDIIRKYNKDYKLIFVGDATMSPYEILQPGGSVEYNNEEPGAEWLQRLTHAFPAPRLDQPRAAGRVGIPPKHRHHSPADGRAHVPPDFERSGRIHEAAVKINPCPSLFTRTRGLAAGVLLASALAAQRLQPAVQKPDSPMPAASPASFTLEVEAPERRARAAARAHWSCSATASLSDLRRSELRPPAGRGRRQYPQPAGHHRLLFAHHRTAADRTPPATATPPAKCCVKVEPGPATMCTARVDSASAARC